MGYIINKKTQAMINIEMGNYRTKIIEEEKTLYSKQLPITIINESSVIYGSTSEGRFETVSRILNTNSKLPTPISPNTGIFLFPTSSIRNKECVWFSYYQIESFQKKQNQLAVLLKGGNKVSVKISWNQFDLQIKKTCQVIAYFHQLLYLA